MMMLMDCDLSFLVKKKKGQVWSEENKKSLIGQFVRVCAILKNPSSPRPITPIWLVLRWDGLLFYNVTFGTFTHPSPTTTLSSQSNDLVFGNSSLKTSG
jgi:hypothetical protein